MSFQTSAYLLRATGRAKSDVANKLVSMILHDVSRKLCGKLDLSVNDPRYAEAVTKAFGPNCCYCGKALEHDRAAIEHLDGMNRFRVGLHVPGNVILACTRCNREKRRDDSSKALKLADSGWESFLLHNSKNCIEECKSCNYWNEVWPEARIRHTNLKTARNRIKAFRSNYGIYLELSAKARVVLTKEIETIYRDCQHFATTRIKVAVEDVLRELGPASPTHI